MEPARVRLIVGFGFVALFLIFILWWIKVNIPWNESDSLGVLTGLLFAIIIGLYLLRVWDFSALRPYDERTMTAEQGLRNGILPIAVFSITFINFLTSRWFSAELNEVVTTSFLITSISTLIFMIVGSWLHRPR